MRRRPCSRSRPRPGGFRVRLDLHGAKPPVWRRLELPGDLTLPRLHDVIQAAMGWTDSHLHRFRTGGDHRSPSLRHAFRPRGGRGRDARGRRTHSTSSWPRRAMSSGTSTTSATAGTTGYSIEEVLDEAPATVRCTAGRMACPPEDCGGIGGYEELAAWVRSGYDDALLPDVFDDAAHAHDWLPLDWHPDHFDVKETNTAISLAIAEPVAVTGELAELAEQLEHRGIRLLREVLGRPLSHGPIEVTDAEAARLSETYRPFLDVIGDGVTLTAAGTYPRRSRADRRTQWDHCLVDRQGQPRGPDISRRRHPHDGSGPRAGERAQGAAESDRGCRAGSPGSAGALAAHRRPPALGQQGR